MLTARSVLLTVAAFYNVPLVISSPILFHVVHPLISLLLCISHCFACLIALFPYSATLVYSTHADYVTFASAIYIYLYNLTSFNRHHLWRSPHLLCCHVFSFSRPFVIFTIPLLSCFQSPSFPPLSLIAVARVSLVARVESSKRHEHAWASVIMHYVSRKKNVSYAMHVHS